MRWPQFLLTLINLAFAIYLIILNGLFFTQEINPYTFLWALIYLTLAIALSHLYMLYMSNKIDDWYDVDSIKSIANLSVFAVVFSGAGLLTFLGLQYYRTKKIVLFEQNELLKTPLIPLAASLVCGLILFMSTIKFKKYVTLCQSIDLQPTQRKNYRTTD